ncbi:MAG: transcription elongation factor GreA [Actinomycetota bacterium]
MELPPELAARPERRPGQKPTATLTLDAYTRLKTELDELKTTGRTTIAERLLHARELGDISENAEYDSAKNEQGLMEARIRKLDQMLRDPDIVEAPASAESVVAGMAVTLRPLGEEDAEDERYLLADSGEERHPEMRTITTTSPLGSVLVGKKTGDEVAYDAPGGNFRYRIVDFHPVGS